MNSLQNEENILSSDDKSITLTNQRVIYKTEQESKEILLKDIVGYEIINKRTISFLIGAILSALVVYFQTRIPEHRTIGEAYQDQHSPHYVALLAIVVTIGFLISYFKVTKKFLKISGRYNSLEFSIKNLSKNSLDTFLKKLSVESDNRKNE